MARKRRLFASKSPHRRAGVLGALWVVLAAACGGSAPDASDVAMAVQVSPLPASVGPTTVTLTLTGADGVSVEGASIEVEGNMSHAGMVPSFGSAREIAPGRYEVELDLTMGGDWFLLIRGSLADGRILERMHDLPGVSAKRNT